MKQGEIRTVAPLLKNIEMEIIGIIYFHTKHMKKTGKMFSEMSATSETYQVCPSEATWELRGFRFNLYKAFHVELGQTKSRIELGQTRSAWKAI